MARLLRRAPSPAWTLAGRVVDGYADRLLRKKAFRLNSTSLGRETVDYRHEDGRFPVSVTCVTISNPESLSSSETGLHPG
jgi:hypothetical protein